MLIPPVTTSPLSQCAVLWVYELIDKLSDVDPGRGWNADPWDGRSSKPEGFAITDKFVESVLAGAVLDTTRSQPSGGSWARIFIRGEAFADPVPHDSSFPAVPAAAAAAA